MINNEALIQIEKCLLSALLFSPEKYEEVVDIISPADFILPLHTHFFKACGGLISQNKEVTPEFLCIEISKYMRVELDDIHEIAAYSPLASLESYALEIKNASINRNLVKLAGFMRDESLKEHTRAQNTLTEVEKRIYALSLKDSTNDFKNANEIATSAVQLLKQNIARDGVLKGFDTGFKELNNATTGFSSGELIVVGGRPSMGKTAFMLSVASTMIKNGVGVALFNLEMPVDQLFFRMLAGESKVPLFDLRSGRLDDMQLERIQLGIQTLTKNSLLYIDDNTNLTLSTLRSKMRKLSAKDKNVRAIMIDYLQLMDGARESSASARHEVVAEISRGLKNLARELGMPVIVLSQLNRGLENREDKRPNLSDLRESGAIEQDADIVIFVYRDSVYKERESRLKAKQDKNYTIYTAPPRENVELILAKNRNGETKTINAVYRKFITLFQDSDKIEYDSNKAGDDEIEW